MKDVLVKVCLLPALVGLGAAWCSGCGSGGGTEPAGLEIYSGSYQLSETLDHQEGSGCAPAPGSTLENRLTVVITGNQFRADFADRWGRLLGEIGSDASFVAVAAGSDNNLSLQLSGMFPSELEVQAVLKEVRQGCSRWFNMSGSRPEAEP